MTTLNESQIKRQDFDDNAIFSLIQSLNTTDNVIDWNIEMIGEIRDVLTEWYVHRLRITTEQTFFPYIEE